MARCDEKYARILREIKAEKQGISTPSPKKAHIMQNNPRTFYFLTLQFWLKHHSGDQALSIPTVPSTGARVSAG
jgi:hypothetical protein